VNGTHRLQEKVCSSVAWHCVFDPSGIHTTQHRVEADPDTLCQDMKMFQNPGGIQQDATIPPNDLIILLQLLHIISPHDSDHQQTCQLL